MDKPKKTIHLVQGSCCILRIGDTEPVLSFECVRNSVRVKKNIDCDRTEDYSYCYVKDEIVDRKMLLAKKGRKDTARKKTSSINLHGI